MKTKLFFAAMVCLLLLALPLNVVAQTVVTRSFSSTTGNRDEGTWIHTSSTGDDIITWGTGFGDMLELTMEQTNDLQEVMEALDPFSPPDQVHPVWLRGGINYIRTKLGQVLTPEQQLQYMEISFQASGGLDSRHLNDQLLDVVNLTDAQKDQIRKLRAEREAEGIAARNERGVGQPFDWQNATQEERDKYVAAQVADQMANREVDEARDKRYAEQMKAVLTAEQRAKAEKLTAEAPALVERFMGKKQDVQQQGRLQQNGRTPAYTYVPGTGAWQPGDPIPEGLPVERNERRRFPRSE